MGSGAKIALVALLILMVVAVAKFVQNGKEEGIPPGGGPGAQKKDAGVVGEKKDPSGQPRLVKGSHAERRIITNRPGSSTGTPAAIGVPGSAVIPGSPPGPGTVSGAGSSAGSPPAPSGALAQRQPADAPHVLRREEPQEGMPPQGSPFPPPRPIASGSSSGGAASGPSSGGVAPSGPGAGDAEARVPGAAAATSSTSSPGTIAGTFGPRSDPSPAAGPAGAVLNRDLASKAGGPGESAPAVKLPEVGTLSMAEEIAGGAAAPGARSLPRTPRADHSAPSALLSFPVSHKVESGESYWRLAEKYYGPGKGKLYTLVSAANGGAKLIAGKTIKIPAPPAAPKEGSPAIAQGSARPAAARAQGGVVSSDGQYDYYLVQRGDTLSTLAVRFYQSPAKTSLIEAANPSLRYETLREGAKIRIPKK
jgi:nucleoid-associated protein YgaU